MLAFLAKMGDLGFAYLSAGLGAGLTTIGAGIGIGRIAANAMDGIARQPEAAAKIQTAMIIAAALIEGIALLCSVICLLLNLKV